MIRAKMKAGGLPEDMYYLALVESGFDPHAYSRAAAVGMWQFMTSTARDMGMRVDWWVDERRDPVRSTSAAVRFIRGLRDQFGSLYLAAAAYNGGPGRVSRGLARYADDLENTAGDDAFFVLAEKDYLRNETREYVPQLIAAALIAKEPARYGMTIHTLPALAYDSVRVPPSTPLAAIAKAAHASTRDIVDLNPHLLRGMTPAARQLSDPHSGGERRIVRQRLRRAPRRGPGRHSPARDQEGRHAGAPGACERDLRVRALRVQSLDAAPEAQRATRSWTGSPDPDDGSGGRQLRRARPGDRAVPEQHGAVEGAHRASRGIAGGDRAPLRHDSRAPDADQRAPEAGDLPRPDAAALRQGLTLVEGREAACGRREVGLQKAFGRQLESRRPNEEREGEEYRSRRMTDQVTP
jgi:hypothetical protein